MKVFISWSGERSRLIGEAFYSWLPTIIQSIVPWMSSQDVDRGTNWTMTLAKELEDNVLGLICLTPENRTAPWLMFEAGALSKFSEQARVWTVLHQLQNSDIEGPLAQFQHTRIEKEEIRKLLRDMNTASGSPLINEELLDVTFRRGWPELEKEIAAVPDKPTQDSVPDRTTNDMVREVLELVRQQSKLLYRPTPPPVYRPVPPPVSASAGLLSSDAAADSAAGTVGSSQEVQNPYLGAVPNPYTVRPQIDDALKRQHAAANIGDTLDVGALGKGILLNKTPTHLFIKLANNGITVPFDLGDIRVQVVGQSLPEAEQKT